MGTGLAELEKLVVAGVNAMQKSTPYKYAKIITKRMPPSAIFVTSPPRRVKTD